MKGLPRVSSTPSGVDLGPLDAFADGMIRSIVIVTESTRFHGVLIRRKDQVYGYIDACPHAGLPIARAIDAPLIGDGAYVECGWHGALFAPESGLCIAGPCVGARLMAWPLKISDQRVVTA